MKRFQSVTLGGGSSSSGSSGITIGTSVITGGTDTRVLFDDAGVIGEDAGLTYVKGTDTLTTGQLIDSGLTASRIVVSDASKQLASNGSITTNALTRSASSGATLAAASATDDGSITTLTKGSKVVLGTGTGFGTFGGLLAKGAPALATTGTAEEVLATITIPANTLNVDGALIRYRFFFHTAANANNKQVRLRLTGLGGTLILDSTAIAANNLNIWISNETGITRLSATTATATGGILTDANATGVAAGSAFQSTLRGLAITWANANDLVITGTTPTSAGDLTLDTYFFEVLQ